MKPEELKARINNRTTFNLSELSRELLRDADCWENVFVLPKSINERTSYLADGLVQMVVRQPKNDDLRYVAGKLTQALSYLMNSASWREDEMHDFDLNEIRCKLRRIAIQPNESA